MALLMLLALCLARASAAAGASSSCAEEDITSLVQTKTIVHHSINRSLEDDDEVTQDFDTTLGDDEDDVKKRKYFGAARGVANMMIKAIWSPSSWKGSWEFNIQEECRDRHDNYYCQQKERGDCFGDCQWLPREKICKTPRMNQLLHFAEAGENTPFRLYADVGYVCNRRSKEQCEDDGMCSYTETNGWANCDSSPAQMKEVVMQRPFKVLVDRFAECMSLPEEQCEQFGCDWARGKEVAKKQLWADGISVSQGNKENPVFKARLAAAGKSSKCFMTSTEFSRLAFGYVEGSENEKKIAKVVESRQELIANTPRAELKLSQWGSPDVIKTRCGTGPWAKLCHKIMKQSWTCVNDEKTKDQCLASGLHGGCSWAVFTSTMCDIGYEFLDENCPDLGPDADGSTSADWKVGPRPEA